MTIKQLQQIRRSLPKGWRKKICETTGFSQSYVGQVLKGNKSNETIADALLDLANTNVIARRTKQILINDKLSEIGGIHV